MSSCRARIGKFAAYALGTWIRPSATFQKLLSEPKPMAYGSFAILLVGTLYTITTGIGYLQGFGAHTPPFLPFTQNEYYRYQFFFVIVVFWLCAVAFCAVVQFLSAFLGGEGTFEELVAVSGFSLYLTIIPFMWIPETIMFAANLHSAVSPLVGTIGLPPAIDLYARQGGTVLWQVAVTIIGVKTVQRYSWLKAAAIGLLGMLVYQALFWTYIR